MATLNIGKEFNPDPSGRYDKNGPASGERFREDFLRPRVGGLGKGERLTVILDDGVEAYGSSFLTEGFAGMVKYGYIKADELLEKINFAYEDQDFRFFEERIKSYIKEARFASKRYERK